VKTVKSVTKALRILELFQNNNGEMTLGEIARTTEIDKTTANRLALTLVKEGFLKQRRKRGKYSLGIKLIDIVGTQINAIDMKNTAIPYIIVEFSRLMNESVCFSVWYGNDIMFSRSCENTENNETLPDDWSSEILHKTCVGKIILANMREEDLNKYFRKTSLSKNTRVKIPDIEQIKKQLSVVRRENLSFEEQEGRTGVSGVAAGVKNNEGDTIGAIFVVGSSIRLTRDILEKIAPSVQRCALKISVELGYKI
jgi:IclR family transcriptional regulator, KDG regulon repressor